MDIKTLLEQWEKTTPSSATVSVGEVHLTLQDAARIAALAQMYPHKTQAQIISELLNSALQASEAAFPYRAGSRVIAEDEFGDPIYEDIGPTPRYHNLSRQQAALLLARHSSTNSCAGTVVAAENLSK